MSVLTFNIVTIRNSFLLIFMKLTVVTVKWKTPLANLHQTITATNIYYLQINWPKHKNSIHNYVSERQNKDDIIFENEITLISQ